MFKKGHTQWSFDARSKGARAERLTNLVKTISTLMDDLTVMGEQEESIRLYTITGDRQDPEARFAGNIPRAYPLIASLQAAFDAGQLKVDDETLGFALAGSAYRHLTFQEYFKRDPKMMEKILERFRSDTDLKLAPKDEEKFRAKATTLMEKYYLSQIVPQLPNPTNMPENMRVKSMVVSVLMRDRMSFVMGSDLAYGMINPLDEEDVAQSPDLNSLWQFLHGLRPDRVQDPFQAVKDFESLNALSESMKSDG